jgi:hypothetical protein
MVLRNVAMICGVLLLSLGVTAGTYFVDQQATRRHQNATGLRWARQIFSQLEGMTLYARIQKQKNPVSWAINSLNQSVDARAFSIVHINSPDKRPGESFNFDPNTQLFNYVRTLNHEESAVPLRIQLYLDYLGFLGAKNRIFNDLFIGGFFFLVFLSGLLVLRTRWRSERKTTELIQRILCWVREAKIILTELGTHIRALLRQAHSLTVAAVNSQGVIEALKEWIPSGESRIRMSRVSLNELDKQLRQAEAVALSLEVEASKSPFTTPQYARTLGSFRGVVQKARRLGKESESVLKLLESEFSAASKDVEYALRARDDIFKASQEISVQITKTTDTILGQSRVIENLKGDLASASVKPSVFLRRGRGR